MATSTRPTRLGLVALAFTLGSTACGEASCPVPAGCRRAERAGGTCSCTEWQVVSTQPVPLPYVVIDVRYFPAGTASAFRYGETWDAAMVPRSASTSGSTVRALIRRPDGSEQVARIGSVDAGNGIPVERIGATVLRVGRSRGVWTLSSDVDVRTRSSDWVTLWGNPAVTVSTDAAGGKIVDWSWSGSCFQPLQCLGAEPLSFSIRALRGEVSWGDAHDAFLATLDADSRAGLLAFDPVASGGPPAHPRYQRIAGVLIDGAEAPSVPDTTWRPCTAPAAFEVLAETSVPLPDGDTFVLQYGAQDDGLCAPQRPGLLLGTGTPGCTLRGDLLVDRLGGTLLLGVTAASAACSTE